MKIDLALFCCFSGQNVWMPPPAFSIIIKTGIISASVIMMTYQYVWIKPVLTAALWTVQYSIRTVYLSIQLNSLYVRCDFFLCYFKNGGQWKILVDTTPTCHHLLSWYAELVNKRVCLCVLLFSLYYEFLISFIFWYPFQQLY